MKNRGVLPNDLQKYWTKAPSDEVEQAERDLFAVARRVQLRPYDL